MADYLLALGRIAVIFALMLGAAGVLFSPFVLGHIVSERKLRQGYVLGDAQWAGIKALAVAYLVYGAIFLVLSPLWINP